MSPIQIRLPTSTETQTPSFVQALVDLINEAYQAPETRLLKPGKLRTNPTEVHGWLEKQQLYLAFGPDSNFSHQPVGTIRVHEISPQVSDMGILTVHPGYRSSGLGRRLVARAEEAAVADGSVRMQIEVPFPRAALTGEGEGEDEGKRYLRRWYEGLGYGLVGTRTVLETVPQLVDYFAEGLEFLVMEKRLRE